MESNAQTPPKLKAWAAQVDRVMQQDWCLSIADAGLSNDDLFRYWRCGDEPAQFVAWFGEKYDLIRFDRNPFRPASEPLQNPARQVSVSSRTA